MQFYAWLSRPASLKLRSGCFEAHSAKKSHPWNNQRGIALSVVIISALVFSAAAFGMMTLAMGRVQSADRDAKRLRAQYAAEAGMVLAMERVRANIMGGAVYPPGCPLDTTGTEIRQIDTDDDGSNETSVTITVTHCGTGDNEQISAKVNY